MSNASNQVGFRMKGPSGAVSVGVTLHPDGRAPGPAWLDPGVCGGNFCSKVFHLAAHRRRLIPWWSKMDPSRDLSASGTRAVTKLPPLRMPSA
jgi:hypothetical protein